MTSVEEAETNNLHLLVIWVHYLEPFHHEQQSIVTRKRKETLKTDLEISAAFLSTVLFYLSTASIIGHQLRQNLMG